MSLRSVCCCRWQCRESVSCLSCCRSVHLHCLCSHRRKGHWKNCPGSVRLLCRKLCLRSVRLLCLRSARPPYLRSVRLLCLRSVRSPCLRPRRVSESRNCRQSVRLPCLRLCRVSGNRNCLKPARSALREGLTRREQFPRARLLPGRHLMFHCCRMRQQGWRRSYCRSDLHCRSDLQRKQQKTMSKASAEWWSFWGRNQCCCSFECWRMTLLNQGARSEWNWNREKF